MFCILHKEQTLDTVRQNAKLTLTPGAHLIGEFKYSTILIHG